MRGNTTKWFYFLYTKIHGYFNFFHSHCLVVRIMILVCIFKFVSVISTFIERNIPKLICQINCFKVSVK